jgi:hypothetical protein
MAWVRRQAWSAPALIEPLPAIDNRQNDKTQSLDFCRFVDLFSGFEGVRDWLMFV